MIRIHRKAHRRLNFGKMGFIKKAKPRKRARRLNWTIAQAIKGGTRSARRQKRTPQGRFAGLRGTFKRITKWSRRSNPKRHRKARRSSLPLFLSVPRRKNRKHRAHRKLHLFAPRRTNRKRSHRRYNGKKLFRMHRTHRRFNLGRKLGLGGRGSFVGTLKQYGMPVLGGVLGFGLARWGGGKLGVQIAQKMGWRQDVAGAVGAGAVLAAAVALATYWKKMPAALKGALIVGAGIDVGLRLLGLLMPDTALGQMLSGSVAAAPMLPVAQPAAVPAAAAAAAGFGQYDQYEAGLMGYVREPGTALEGYGGYVPDAQPELPMARGIHGLGAYVQEGGGGGSRFNAMVAPAGMGTMVQEAPAGFLGGPNF